MYVVRSCSFRLIDRLIVASWTSDYCFGYNNMHEKSLRNRPVNRRKFDDMIKEDIDWGRWNSLKLVKERKMITMTKIINWTNDLSRSWTSSSQIDWTNQNRLQLVSLTRSAGMASSNSHEMMQKKKNWSKKGPNYRLPSFDRRLKLSRFTCRGYLQLVS